MGWQTVADLNSTGLATTREVVVPLDLSNVADNLIQIKLSSGFMFGILIMPLLIFLTIKSLK